MITTQPLSMDAAYWAYFSLYRASWDSLTDKKGECR